MDKFLNLQKAKSARLVTAHQRHSKNPFWTHVSGSKLFCTPCNKVIDHLRKSSVDSHRKSADHRSKEDKMKEAQGSDGGEAVKKQRTLDSAMNKPSVSTQARNDICNELVSVFAAANIPLSKVDHPAVRDFLQTRVENGGAIPQAHQLQDCYLKGEFSNKKEQVF
ncbi:CGG triplet repeat-binding protein 1 [Plakobranchus ocellatus]|uniref:CGG triplet repeat-binding protein 1 n=1 Tax=Plakobranchus ocellatus TaxID=259542 RepID=A0AAV4DAU1_9GAST|nr:CGG triplet repeat-binding protein 1 [Plakobranchus ocellatus]